MPHFPRLLVLDTTPTFGAAATSVLKHNNLANWPVNKIMQVTLAPGNHIAAGTNQGPLYRFPPSAQHLSTIHDLFGPEIILFRPINEHPEFQALADGLVLRSPAAMALWWMDDWPLRMMTEASHADRTQCEKRLQALFEKSSLNLAISQSMAEAFGARYGASFEIARNLVREGDWPPPKLLDRKEPILRYAGSLAPDMSLSTVHDLARFADQNASQAHSFSFEIQTQKHWLQQEGHLFKGLKKVKLRRANLSPKRYRRWLQEADALLVAYNDDPGTIRYLSHSFANKIPEVLASGRPIIAIGPTTIESIRFLKDVPGVRIFESVEAFKDAWEPEYILEKNKDARQAAFQLFGMEDGRERLRALLSDRAKPTNNAGDVSNAVRAAARSSSLVKRAKNKLLDWVAS